MNRPCFNRDTTCGATRRWLRRCALACLTGALAGPGASLCSADRNADFVAALRQQGWDDTAVDYLAWVERSPLMTPAFAAELPYQRALSLAAQAGQVKNGAERERLQSEAAAAFEQYAKSRPESPTALEAQREAANLYASQGLATLAAAERLPEQAASQRQQLREEARQQLDRAAAAVRQLVDQCAAGLAGLPKEAAAQADAETKARRDKLRERQVEARFLQARIAFELAATFEAKSQPSSDTLAEASRRFGELVEEYRGSVVGDASRFYQGRCAQELGAYEKALGCYKDVLAAPSANEEFRRLKARAHRRQAECLVALGKVDEAIQWCEEWLAASAPSEREQPEWLEVAYRLGTAYQEKAKSLEAGDGDAKELASKARTLFRDASRRPNEFQQDARLALAALGQPNRGAAELNTFADALAAGKQALELWNSSMLAAKLARENNPEAAPELQDQADGYKAEAIGDFERALELVEPPAAIGDVNAVRYFLAVLYWEEKRFPEAAVLGEFLATQYPEDENALSAAKVAMAAYEQAALEAKAASQPGDSGTRPAAPSYEARKLAELAELVAARWPQSQDAASAVNVLIQTALREDRLADAEALLARLPAESRGAAELSLGAGLWARYLRTAAAERDASRGAAIAERDKAGQLLASGFAALRQTSDPTSAAAAGALYYVQYLLAKGDAAAAIDVLQDEAAGPLALVEAKSPAAARPEYVLETYKAALRAYLAVEPPQPQQVERMMTALEELANEPSGGPAAKKVTDVYLGLGVQLQRQMEQLVARGEQEQARRVAAAFGQVLERVAQRPDAGSWQVRSWLAQMNLEIGKALGGDDARVYADRAREEFQAMLSAAAKEKAYAPDANSLLAVRMKLGECLAAQGDFEQAVQQYAEILRQKPNALDLQLAAARALQQWGVAKRDPAAIERSIRGDLPQPDGKNLVWGWLRLASMAQQARQQAARGTVDAASRERAERFRDLFFEARYNIARSRFLGAGIAPAAERLEHLQAARTNVLQMKQLYPDLGGERWTAAFNELLRQIDEELAKK